MSDAKYFQRGKIQELRAELNSSNAANDKKHTVKRTVMKKIVANMTMGNDMSPLFPDVLACMQVPVLEIKKMVYLYLMNYARTNPEMGIMAVNSFVRDVKDPNPLIRALAIRTMSYMDVDRIVDMLCEPLRTLLRDQDPYVRKTAAIAISKLWVHNSDLCIREGFLDNLKELLNDSNPTVVACALAALVEIEDRSNPDTQVLKIDVSTANKLLTALNECSEWGQVYILESLMFIQGPIIAEDAELLAERIIPRLQHANSAVVLTAVKVILFLTAYMDKEDVASNMLKRLGPPLVTLLHSESEVQYVALRNILLIMSKHATFLDSELKIFFCKYNDPIYVKLTKLEILFRLVTEENITLVLSELKEYASEVDVDFVRKAVRTIGRCAIRVEKGADKCIDALVELIKTKVSYVVQEAVVVIRDIFRKYPNRYESIIGVLCDNLDSLDEPEAKAAMVWIVGQYADRIENAGDLLDTFLDSFKEDPAEVQLSLLTAVVKLFIKRPSAGQDLLRKVLQWATEDTDNPDLRDRGFIYWRLLSTDPNAAKAIVMSEKPTISVEADWIDSTLVDELLIHISTLASIYHRPPDTFLGGFKARKHPVGTHASKKRSTDRNGEENTARMNSDLNLVNPYLNQIAPKMATPQNLLDLDDDRDFSAGGSGFEVPGAADIMNTNMNANVPVNASPNFGTNTFTGITAGMGAMNLTSGQNLGVPVVNATSNVTTGGSRSHSPLEELGAVFGATNVDTFGAQGTAFVPERCLFLNAQNGRGLEIAGTFARRKGQMVMEMQFTNKALAPLGDFAIQFNKNTFCIAPGGPLEVRQPLMPNTHSEALLRLKIDGVPLAMTPINNLQVAVKTSAGIVYFQTLVPLHILFAEGGQLEQGQWLKMWKEDLVAGDKETRVRIEGIRRFSNVIDIKGRMIANNVFVVADRVVDGSPVLYANAKLQDGSIFLIELRFDSQITYCDVTVKSYSSHLFKPFLQAIEGILKF